MARAKRITPTVPDNAQQTGKIHSACAAEPHPHLNQRAETAGAVPVQSCKLPGTLRTRKPENQKAGGKSENAPATAPENEKEEPGLCNSYARES